MVYGGNFSGSAGANIYITSLGKRFARNHYAYLRFTPGMVQNFTILTGTSIVLKDSPGISVDIKENLQYAEKFGIGYSYIINRNLTTGFSLRYFTQNLIKEIPEPYYLPDSISYISMRIERNESAFLNFSAGLSYLLDERLRLGLAFQYPEQIEFVEDRIPEKYKLRKLPAFLGNFSYDLSDYLRMSVLMESTGAHSTGFAIGSDFADGIFHASLALNHDPQEKLFYSSAIPAVGFSSDFFSVSLTGIKYLQRSNPQDRLGVFVEKGITNLNNNLFSGDRIFLNLNLLLSFLPKKSLRFVELELLKNIYPTLAEEYQTKPLATALVINISDQPVAAIPSVMVDALNENEFFSPRVEIAPGDTAKVDFFLSFDPSVAKNEGNHIGTATFTITAENSSHNDILQKPLLVLSPNGWDGIVRNLRYFIRERISFAQGYTKGILSKASAENLDTLTQQSLIWKLRTVYNYAAGSLVYVSDPRGSGEFVQFPDETLKLKGGDCDDLAVLFSALYESIGIETALIDYRNDVEMYHVGLLINTGINTDELEKVSNNPSKIFIRRGADGNEKIWLPLEVTELAGFDEAWRAGAKKFDQEAIIDFGLYKNKIEIIDID